MKEITLNGLWDFIADLDPKYHEGFYSASPPAHEYTFPETDRHFWKKVTVPGVWQKYGERYDIFEGVCWFSRTFELPFEPTNARLRFGGVNYQCDIYINGTHCGSHEGGYTEFYIDVMNFIRVGQNHIAVRVDNRATSIKWPPCLGYFNYGGIHRDVVLEVSNCPSITDVSLSADMLETGWRLIGSVETDGEGELYLDVDGKIIPVSKNFSADLPEVNSWSPDSPRLYPISIILKKDNEILDTKKMIYGFKKIEVKDGAIYLNGAPVRLNGCCYVYDSPVAGLTMTREQVETDLLLMKEMNANAVRCHYPMDYVFYEACDRLGLMVWIEPPVYCYGPYPDVGSGFADNAWASLAVNMAVEMIHTAKNHPCVAVYSIGNECNHNHPEAGPFFTTLASAMRTADPTRLISYASLTTMYGPIADIVDVLGINSYWGWYEKALSQKNNRNDGEREPIDLTAMRNMIDTIIKEGRNGLALLLTEFGADSVSNFYSSSRDLWSENYHADLLDEILALSEEYPQIAGTFPFCFTDYRDPSKYSNGYWNEYNLKGVVTYNRNKKLAFGAVQKKYGV